MQNSSFQNLKYALRAHQPVEAQARNLSHLYYNINIFNRSSAFFNRKKSTNAHLHAAAPREAVRQLLSQVLAQRVLGDAYAMRQGYPPAGISSSEGGGGGSQRPGRG